MAVKKPNHELSGMRCPAHLEDVDLFSPGAAEHWYEAYEILHKEAPVHRIPGEGYLPGTDGFILSKYEDIALVVREEARFPPAMTLALRQLMEQGGDVFDQPNINSAVAGMVTLRPTPEMWPVRDHWAIPAVLAAMSGVRRRPRTEASAPGSG